MPQNELGYKHVLVVVCYLSKYVVARPLKTRTSTEVVAELLGIYLTFGVPKICQHDQGEEFTSKVRNIILCIFCHIMIYSTSFTQLKSTLNASYNY